MTATSSTHWSSLQLSVKQTGSEFSRVRVKRGARWKILVASAVTQASYWTVVVKSELSQEAKLSPPTLTCGHKLWAVTEKTQLDHG